MTHATTHKHTLPYHPWQLEREAQAGAQTQAHEATNEAQHGQSQRRGVLWVGHKLLVVLYKNKEHTNQNPDNKADEAANSASKTSRD